MFANFGFLDCSLELPHGRSALFTFLQFQIVPPRGFNVGMPENQLAYFGRHAKVEKICGQPTTKRMPAVPAFPKHRANIALGQIIQIPA